MSSYTVTVEWPTGERVLQVEAISSWHAKERALEMCGITAKTAPVEHTETGVPSVLGGDLGVPEMQARHEVDPWWGSR